MPVEQHKEKNYPKDARSIYEAALDALECKLMFGARPGVTLTVVTWFLAHLENKLGIPQTQ